MKMQLNLKPARKRGYSLVITLTIGATGLAILAGVMRWGSHNSSMIDRNNRYFRSLAAAEAATEKVLSQISADFNANGPAYVEGRLDTYRALVPTAVESPVWGDYRFTDATGNADRTYVQTVTPWSGAQAVTLNSQYRGLSAYASTHRIISNASETGIGNVTAGIAQEVQLALIPLFQFAIFYNMDLEMHPGANMTVRGRVHSNRKIYTQPNPGVTLTFNGDVTAVDSIIEGHMTGDSRGSTAGTVVYNGAHDTGVTSLNLPIGTDNTPENVRKIIEVPPSSEDPASALGKVRLFNQADLIILTYNDRVEAAVRHPVTKALKSVDVSGFVKTNASFTNGREGKTIKATEIDVGQLGTWSDTSNPFRADSGRDIATVYVADLRTQTSSTQQGVRLVNGADLSKFNDGFGGLTVVSQDPLYVQGDYNATGSALGSSNTQNAKPAAFIADAITVLSSAWKSGDYDTKANNQTAANTTINAAFLSGIVPTAQATDYSGGVENFPRFLENWGGKTFTYNGSMIVMFPSQVAKAPWKNSTTYYSPPSRNWAFDTNFLNPNKLPPNTPMVRTMVRGQWTVVPPNTTTYTVAVN